MEMILLSSGIFGISFLFYLNRMSLKTTLDTVKHEIKFFFLGCGAVIDDALFARRNKLEDLPDKTNKVAVVTGGGRGIGFEVVKKLLQCNMRVLIGCRNVEAGENAVKLIRKQGIEAGSAVVFSLDTSSMHSVEEFAKNVMENTEEVHLLINNAGIMAVPYSTTVDGFESQLAVNYLGHFYLSHLLLPKMIKAGHMSPAKPRIVNVSSCVHIMGTINFDDMNYKKSYYRPNEAYAQSKLAQVMFTKALDRYLKACGFNVTSVAVHPGVVNTGLFTSTPIYTFAPWVPKLLFKSPEQGARSVVFAAVSDILENCGGVYISNCHPTWTSSEANNEELQERLMKLTMDFLNIEKFGCCKSLRRTNDEQ